MERRVSGGPAGRAPSAGSYPDASEAGRGPEGAESPERPEHPHGGDLVHRDEPGQVTKH